MHTGSALLDHTYFLKLCIPLKLKFSSSLQPHRTARKCFAAESIAERELAQIAEIARSLL